MFISTTKVKWDLGIWENALRPLKAEYNKTANTLQNSLFGLSPYADIGLMVKRTVINNKYQSNQLIINKVN